MSSLFVIIFALCISIAVNANLTKSFLMCTGKEELFRCFPAQQFFMIFFSGLTFRISMPPLARLGLSSRAHFGARSEQCTTWPPGTCSSQSRSSIGPSSSLEEGRSWCQVIIENGHCIVCNLNVTSHQQIGISETERKRRKESNYFTTQITFIAWLLEVIHKTNHINHYFDFLSPGLAGHYL